MRTLRVAVARLCALVAWVWSSGVLVAALAWGVGLRCDESCGGPGWRRSPDGWQWDGVVALGVLAFLAGTALVVLVWRARRVLAAAAFFVGLGAVLALATALSPEWPEHVDSMSGQEALVFLSGLGAPIAAVLLAVRRGGEG